MAPIYKIAVIQLHPKPMQIESNYAKAAEFIKTAASQGAQLAVLPEYHLTNWVPDDPKFSDLCGQWEIYLDKYRALAKAHNICIVPGTIVERHQDAGKEESKLINVAYFIDNKGEILGSYQKKNLWHPERPHLTSSTHDTHDVIQTPLGPVGLLICWDVAFPEAFRELIAQGAKIIIIPTFWTLTDCSPYGLSLNPLAEAVFLKSILTSRAYENTCAVVFANAGGPCNSSKPNPYAGLSRVTMPFLGALGAETKDSGEEGMSIVELDMRILEEAEKQYKVREDLASEDWHYLYRHSATLRDGKGMEGRERGKL
ncbi:hypothetical protein MMC24_002305 [Lignoscripta atroalba]|nr:hypothetical protein [Lignoscripta atroalba]